MPCKGFGCHLTPRRWRSGMPDEHRVVVRVARRRGRVHARPPAARPTFLAHRPAAPVRRLRIGPARVIELQVVVGRAFLAQKPAHRNAHRGDQRHRRHQRHQRLARGAASGVVINRDVAAHAFFLPDLVPALAVVDDLDDQQHHWHCDLYAHHRGECGAGRETEPDQQAHRKIDLGDLHPAAGLERSRQQLAKGDTDGGADENPDGQVTRRRRSSGGHCYVSSQHPIRIRDSAVGTLSGAAVNDRIFGPVYERISPLFRDQLGRRAGLQRIAVKPNPAAACLKYNRKNILICRVERLVNSKISTVFLASAR